MHVTNLVKLQTILHAICNLNVYLPQDLCLLQLVQGCLGHQNTDSICLFMFALHSVMNICHCSNGTPATRDECTVDGAHTCASCHGGYYLDGSLCPGTLDNTPRHGILTTLCASANVCVCSNGTPVAEPTCATHGENICSTCNSGYYMHFNSCKGTYQGCRDMLTLAYCRGVSMPLQWRHSSNT